MKDLENEIGKKNSTVSELKMQLKEASEKQQSTQNTIIQLKEQVRCSSFILWFCIYGIIIQSTCVSKHEQLEFIFLH